MTPYRFLGTLPSEMSRSIQIRVRLAPASTKGVAAVQVLLNEQEREALEAAARAMEATSEDKVGLSTFLRAAGVAVAQAGRYPGENVVDLVSAAAADAGLGVGEWLRVVALASVDATALRRQLAFANDWANAGFGTELAQ